MSKAKLAAAGELYREGNYQLAYDLLASISDPMLREQVEAAKKKVEAKLSPMPPARAISKPSPVSAILTLLLIVVVAGIAYFLGRLTTPLNVNTAEGTATTVALEATHQAVVILATGVQDQRATAVAIEANNAAVAAQFTATEIARRIVPTATSTRTASTTPKPIPSATFTPFPTWTPFVQPSIAFTATPAAGKWVLKQDKSLLDDSTTITLTLDAEDKFQAWLGSKQASLILRCKEGKVDAYVYTDTQAAVEYGLTDEARARTRFDQQAPFTEILGESTSGNALFYPEPYSIINAMLSSQRMVFEFTPFNAAPAQMVFDVQGLSEAIGPLKKACNWQ